MPTTFPAVDEVERLIGYLIDAPAPTFTQPAPGVYLAAPGVEVALRIVDVIGLVAASFDRHVEAFDMAHGHLGFTLCAGCSTFAEVTR